jgi:hypothetical protein
MSDQGWNHDWNHHAWEDAPLWARVIREMLRIVTLNQETIMSALTDLQAAVAAEDTVIASAVTLLNGIPALIAAAGTDPAALAALQQDIITQTSSLAQAVVTGTPAATTPPVTTPPASARK